MQISTFDWAIIAAFFIVSLGIGFYASRRAGKSFNEYFLSGRDMPWWLLGVSMVATTFSADTPNLVTDFVRQHGVAKNWEWWAFCLTGMLTVFVYAKLWRRSGIKTDLEFYELRYSGPAARFLRGFRAIYLGVFFNVVIMATVILAGIKLGGVLLGWSATQTILIAGVITVAYTLLGGLRGVILTDFFQFGLAMVGMIAACIYVINLPEVGGLNALLSHEMVAPKLDLVPDPSNWEVFVPVFLIPIAVQWWSVWYPGAEPGGGGYIVQRMLSAKDEKNAIGATFLFNVAHYALRPWPWILIALASIIVYPSVQDMATAFPHVEAGLVKEDLAFSAMLSLLPSGLLGLVTAGLIAAFMSTISTHLNWGSSYLVNDFYVRFVKPEATEKEMVNVGRISIVIMFALAALLAPVLQNAEKAFNLLLQIGAGTGLLFILRWFWWRINASAEIVAMIVSFLIACVYAFVDTGVSGEWQLISGVLITTVAWMTTALSTKPTDAETLTNFYQLIKPHATGWRKFLVANKVAEIPTSGFSRELTCMFAGVFLVYGTLFGTGYLLYGRFVPALVGLAAAVVSAFIVVRNWRSVG
ncbi:Na+:solute symporter [Lewinellaceae bacterium SD302]|nr:Na+:solute symporter [Lewinellaceae bacterium SD302]